MMKRDFLQSADWARFQATVGHPSLEADGVRFFKNFLPFGGGSYLYCPHPLIVEPREFLESVRKIATDEHPWFVRVEPNIGSARITNYELRITGKDNASPPTTYDLRPTAAVQPQHTWHVPLGSDEAMLAAMHEKTRYNIRVAQKRGVAVRFSNNPPDVDILTNLISKTGNRAGIRLHAAEYYRAMLEVLGVRSEKVEARGNTASSRFSPLTSHLTTELAIAEANNRPIAAALIAHYGDRAIYLHGGSDYEQRVLMAPQALHWAIMRRARDAGAMVYDMGGVAPTEPARSEKQAVSGATCRKPQPLTPHPSPLTTDSHPWAGITRFKRGFGGVAVEYPPAVDVVVNRTMYAVYQLGRKLSRLIK
jgi:lipid II:glycine glycyltransferase (peptidoglycan interpeptide bridge formation enzyme)